LVLAAGVAQAEVTFSGKAEAGFSRTEKTAAVAAVTGVQTQIGTSGQTATDGTYDAETDGTVALTSGTAIAATAATKTAAKTTDVTLAAALVVLESAKAKYNSMKAIHDANGLLDVDATGLDVTTGAGTTNAAAGGALADMKIRDDALNYAAGLLAQAQAAYNAAAGTAAVAAVAAGDMKAYSGYDLEVAVSSTLDNGMVVSAGFDMGAGSIADRDDDRVLDAQAAAVALSAVTIKNGGVTYVIGQDKIDDLYDDTQNGDVSVSGAMGGISYTLVADLDKDTKAVAASTKYTVASSSGAGDSTFVETAAVAAVHESTSLKLSGAAGGVTWSFTTTNKDDFGDAASLVSLGYAAGDALSFTLKHDTDGAAEAINTLSATYTMDAISLTVSAADDKNHARNTNTGGKASQNMTIAYANGPLSASFNNDESSAWWATTSYDLGNGADIFATVDHQEFAVVGLSFNF
jgi:hypothetical protein